MDDTGERFLPSTTDWQVKIEHLQRYESIIPFIKDKLVLDAACGEGYGAFYMASYAQKVWAVDISAEAIAVAEMNYIADNLIFTTSSVTALTAIEDQSVDVVVSFETIEHITEEQDREI